MLQIHILYQFTHKYPSFSQESSICPTSVCNFLLEYVHHNTFGCNIASKIAHCKKQKQLVQRPRPVSPRTKISGLPSRGEHHGCHFDLPQTPTPPFFSCHPENTSTMLITPARNSQTSTRHEGST